jgi:hypothetical protein
LEENHENACGFPDFLPRGTSREQRFAAFFTESRMQFVGPNEFHRKSGFGLHRLRNRSKRDTPLNLFSEQVAGESKW